jgi:hypothetical protein
MCALWWSRRFWERSNLRVWKEFKSQRPPSLIKTYVLRDWLGASSPRRSLFVVITTATSGRMKRNFFRNCVPLYIMKRSRLKLGHDLDKSFPALRPTSSDRGGNGDWADGDAWWLGSFT